ncbi:hypothetical protein HA49_22790 [Tatumella morbirosei]|uniref:Transposase n=1 Tax=Tatumella morbirosei TaxID=642227 RepID=A0A0F5BUU1_9GAMM|nr:hypothetical protein HA49_22790 [Tatumella morbirosei]
MTWQRLPVSNPARLATPEAINQCWSVDFIHDALVSGRLSQTFGDQFGILCSCNSIATDSKLFYTASTLACFSACFSCPGSPPAARTLYAFSRLLRASDNVTSGYTAKDSSFSLPHTRYFKRQ